MEGFVLRGFMHCRDVMEGVCDFKHEEFKNLGWLGIMVLKILKEVWVCL
jgi:hypothetical protein